MTANGSALGMAALRQATATDGMVVLHLHDGRLVCEYYAHGTAAHTPHILMSATKSVVGLLAGILQHSGALDVVAEARDADVPDRTGRERRA